jgi:hypothetical protein
MKSGPTINQLKKEVTALDTLKKLEQLVSSNAFITIQDRHRRVELRDDSMVILLKTNEYAKIVYFHSSAPYHMIAVVRDTGESVKLQHLERNVTWVAADERNRLTDTRWQVTAQTAAGICYPPSAYADDLGTAIEKMCQTLELDSKLS